MTILSNNYTLDHIFHNFLSQWANNNELLVTPNSIDNYSSAIEELDSNVRELTLRMLQDKLESLDEAFFGSSLRKRDYRVKSKRSRTLLTVFGQLTYTRRVYESKIDKSYYIYVDRKMGLPKYDTYDPTVKAKLCESYITLGSMLKAGQTVGEQIYCSFSTKLERKNFNITRQTVYNTLKNIHRLQPSIDRSTQTPETLYIMADEKYVSTQQGSKTKVMVKHAVAFEGFSRAGNRNTLTNKLHFTSLDHRFWEQFHDFLAQVYDLSKIKNIVLMGDGATWIKAGTYEFSNSSFHLDKFHMFQAINQMSKDSILHYNLRQTLLKDDKELFNQITKVILIQNENNLVRIESIKDKQGYILRHWDSIQRTLNSKLSCPMESHISHNLASIFTSRPKAYSVENLRRYVSLRDLHLNNIDIQSAYLKTLHYEKSDKVQSIEKEVYNFSMFEPNSNYDKSSTSNWVKGFISRN